MAALKHIYTRATADEIQRAVGVTEEDRKVVAKVLAELGSTPGRGEAYRSASTGQFTKKLVAAKKATAAKSASRKLSPQKSK
jgi:hypothetical protein